MTIWREFAPILPLFDYAVFDYNHHNGSLHGVDWVAVDILLRREDVIVSSEDFTNFRLAMIGYVNAINEYIADTSKN